MTLREKILLLKPHTLELELYEPMSLRVESGRLVDITIPNHNHSQKGGGLELCGLRNLCCEVSAARKLV